MVINGFVNVVISTLERRFELQSTQTGLIAGCYDIGSMIAVIPISYFGGRLGISKPKFVHKVNVKISRNEIFFFQVHFSWVGNDGIWIISVLTASLSDKSILRNS